MASPASIDEFLELVRKSGVLEEKRLHAYLDKARAAAPLPPDPAALAAVLVRDGLLTHFQAEQLLLGKWRRFTIGKYKVLERLGARASPQGEFKFPFDTKRCTRLPLKSNTSTKPLPGPETSSCRASS